MSISIGPFSHQCTSLTAQFQPRQACVSPASLHSSSPLWGLYISCRPVHWHQGLYSSSPLLACTLPTWSPSSGLYTFCPFWACTRPALSCTSQGLLPSPNCASARCRWAPFLPGTVGLPFTTDGFYRPPFLCPWLPHICLCQRPCLFHLLCLWHCPCLQPCSGPRRPFPCLFPFLRPH